MTNSLTTMGANDEILFAEAAQEHETQLPNMWQRIKGYVGTTTLAIGAVIGAADNTSAQEVFASRGKPTSTTVTSTNTAPNTKTTSTKITPAIKIDDSYLQFPVDDDTRAETLEYRKNNGEVENVLGKELFKSPIFRDEFLPLHMEQAVLDRQDPGVRGPFSKMLGHYIVWLETKSKTTQNESERKKYQAELNKYPLAVNTNKGLPAGQFVQGVHVTIMDGKIPDRFDVGWYVIKDEKGSQTIINGAITNIEHGQNFTPTTDDIAKIRGIGYYQSTSFGTVRHQKYMATNNK